MRTGSTSTSPASPGRGRFARLSPGEAMYLKLERVAWPGHIGGLAVLDGRPLLDASGQVRLEEIRDRIERRLPAVPQLRRRVHFPGWLRGRPLWVDDREFAVANHVRQAAVAALGGGTQLFEMGAELYGRLLDRRHPLWELWFLTGLADGRIGALLKLHHSVADGLAVVRIIGSLFDVSPETPDPVPVPWKAEAVPSGWSLLADNLSTKVRRAGRGVAALAHPGRIARGARLFAQVVRKTAGMRGAARTSLNRRVEAGRRIGFLRLDLAATKGVAHAQGGKVNDVVLALWGGGLRNLLTSRGEQVAGVEPTTGVMFSTRSAADSSIDNQVGTIVLPLPIGEGDVRRRVDLIVAKTREVKNPQRSAAIMGALVGIAASPVGRYFLVHQRATNTLTTNVTGPPLPLYVLGAPVLDILPVMNLTGNVGLDLCALSYAGRLYLVVTADATAFPDLDVLIEGMERDWHALAGD